MDAADRTKPLRWLLATAGLLVAVTALAIWLRTSHFRPRRALHGSSSSLPQLCLDVADRAQHEPKWLAFYRCQQTTHPPPLLRFAVADFRGGATGWGNRLRAMLSTFLLALVSGRRFVVRHAQFHAHFDAADAQLNWTAEAALLPFVDAAANDMDATAAAANEANTTFAFNVNIPEHRSMLLSADFSHARHLYLVHFMGDSFDALLARNPHHGPLLAELFGTSRSNRTGQVMRWMLSRPAPAFLCRVALTQQTLRWPRPLRLRVNVSGGNGCPGLQQQPQHGLNDAGSAAVGILEEPEESVVVGLQIRTLRDVSAYVDWRGYAGRYLACARRVLLAGGLTGKRATALFFTSDRPELLARVRREFGFGFGDTGTAGGLGFRVMALNTTFEHTSFVDPSAISNAIVDWFLLGECRASVTSASTFSLFALARRGFRDQTNIAYAENTLVNHRAINCSLIPQSECGADDIDF